MPTKPSYSIPTPESLIDASAPLADTPRGGVEFAFRGVTIGKKRKRSGPAQPPDPTGGGGPSNPASGVLSLAGGGTAAPANTPNGETGPHTQNLEPSQQEVPEQSGAQDFAGMGPWLEDDDEAVFRRANDLVMRQELIAQSRLAQDTYFTYVKLGYPMATLFKDPNKSVYRCELPAGSKPIAIEAVPNQAWDLVNKATEAILADPPQPDPAPLNDSEEAGAAAEMAERFLTEDAGENGTNDIQTLYNAVDGALSCATKYVELWTDPVGGGYVPLQILAHPETTDPANPLVGPDGMPTANPVLRYVTSQQAPQGAQGTQGQPSAFQAVASAQGQPHLRFTDEPSEADPEWQPRIRASVWGREHWRLYPETETVATAHMAIGLLYCTLGEAKRRWKDVAAMEQEELDTLLDWTPPRYLVLLPPYQRARWRVSSGAEREKAGSSDERIMFYYRVMVKADPDHRKGVDLIVTGARQGKVLDRNILGMDVELPPNQATVSQRGQQPMLPEGQQPGKITEPRCMDLMLVQVTPRADPDEKDPTGRAYMQLFSGATEFDAALRVGFLEALNQWLHPDSYIPSTSTVQSYQVRESRATDEPIPILSKDDMVLYGNQPPLPAGFWDAADHNQQAIRSIASLDKAVTGEQDPTKESGKALQLAIGRALVGLARMNLPVNSAYERFCRCKLQLAMRDYKTPQMARYVGEDGAYKVAEFRGIDFALVGDVGIQAGTGTMMPPEQKVMYLANVRAAGFLPPEEAADAARMTFAQRLGLPDDPHQQYIERAVALWLQGMPEGFKETWQTYMQQRQQYHQIQAQQVQAGVVDPTHPEQAAAALPPPQEPWTPFADRPNDKEPAIAGRWAKRLSKVMSTAKYAAMPVEWRQALDEKYQRAQQIVTAAQQAMMAAQAGQGGQGGPPQGQHPAAHKAAIPPALPKPASQPGQVAQGQGSPAAM